MSIIATDNLSAMSWSDSFWNWAPGKEKAMHIAQNLSSHWSSLSPTQRNIALATGVLLLGGTAAAYKYNNYQQMQKLAEEQRANEQRSREELSSDTLREFNLNIENYKVQMQNLDLIKDRTLDNRIHTVNELIKIFEQILNNIEQRYPQLNDTDKEKAHDTIKELLKKLHPKKEQYEEEKREQEIIREEQKDIKHQELEEIRIQREQEGVRRQEEEKKIKESKLLSSYQKNIERIKAKPLQNQKSKFQSLLKLINFDDQLKPEEKADLSQTITLAIEPAKIKFIYENLSYIKSFLESLEKKDIRIKEDEIIIIEHDLNRIREEIQSLQLMSHKKPDLFAEVRALKRKLLQIQHPTSTELRKLETKLDKQSQSERYNALRQKEISALIEQRLKEKREGKEEEQKKSSSNSAASVSGKPRSTLSIFNNTNTTLKITYVYASSSAQHNTVDSGQKIDIPLNGSPLKSLRYQEDSRINLNPYPYRVNISKLPTDTSSLLTISWGITAFYDSITPIISTEQMIQDGLELNNALRSGNDGEVKKLKNNIDDLYSRYPLFLGKTKEATEQYMVKSLVLYYYAIAKKLGHIFTEGTFVIYDDTGKIFRFLSLLNNKYKRYASHFNGVAQTEGYSWLEQREKEQFGFDLDLIEEMGKRTILFNKLNEDGTALYIKPENYPPHHPMHALEFAWAQGADNDIDSYSKERVPKYIQEEYEKLLNTAEQNIKEKKLPDYLEQRLITKLNGLRKYINKGGMGIQRMLEIANGNPPIVTNYASEEAQAFIDMLNEKHNSPNPLTRAKYTHLDKRFGHEVILTNDEFNEF